MKKSVMILMLALLLLLSACSGNRQYIMSEKEINKIPAIDEIIEYSNSIIWARIHPVLLMSEGAGLRHDLFLEDGRSFIGIKTKRNNKDALMIIIPNAELDFFETKGIISSRSGKNFYSLDGRNLFSENGFLTPKLNWNSIKSIIQSVEVWHDISDPDRKQIVNDVLVNVVGKNLDQQKNPRPF